MHMNTGMPLAGARTLHRNSLPKMIMGGLKKVSSQRPHLSRHCRTPCFWPSLWLELYH